MAQSSVARGTLKKARLFLAQAAAAWPEDREAFRTNLEAAIVFGRSVTFHIQKEYAHREGFMEWYGPHRTRMDADPVSRYFNEQRSFILKEGPLAIRHTISISYNVDVVVTDRFDVRVIRGQPWYRRSPKVWWEDVREMVMRPIRRHRERRQLAAIEAARRHPPVGEIVEASHFAQPGLQDRPAVDVVREYLDGLAG